MISWVKLSVSRLTEIEIVPSSKETLEAANLLLVDFNAVAVFHLELLRRLVVVDASAVEQEAQRVHRDALAIAVGLLELSHVGRVLDLEMDLAVVLADYFQLDVLFTALTKRKQTQN